MIKHIFKYIPCDFNVFVNLFTYSQKKNNKTKTAVEK